MISHTLNGGVSCILVQHLPWMSQSWQGTGMLRERTVCEGPCARPAMCLSPSTSRGMRPGAQSLVASFSTDDLDNLQLETPHPSGDAAAQVTPTARLSPQAA